MLTDGLALRRASIRPFDVGHLDAPDGLQGFVDRLGPMLERLGKDARTGYDWTEAQIAAAHAALWERVPLDRVADRRARRDRRIMALRRMKAGIPDPT